MKFGFDKRKLHYSSQIASGQLTREKALELLDQPLFTKQGEEEKLLSYVLKKLELSAEQWANILNGPKRYFFDYKNREWALNYDNPVVNKIRNIAKSQD